jgi:hypothetical protein
MFVYIRFYPLFRTKPHSKFNHISSPGRTSDASDHGIHEAPKMYFVWNSCHRHRVISHQSLVCTRFRRKKSANKPRLHNLKELKLYWTALHLFPVIQNCLEHADFKLPSWKPKLIRKFYRSACNIVFNTVNGFQQSFLLYVYQERCARKAEMFAVRNYSYLPDF